MILLEVAPSVQSSEDVFPVQEVTLADTVLVGELQVIGPLLLMLMVGRQVSAATVTLLDTLQPFVCVTVTV